MFTCPKSNSQEVEEPDLSPCVLFPAHLPFFFLPFYFLIILDLQKSCKDGAESFHTPSSNLFNKYLT